MLKAKGMALLIIGLVYLSGPSASANSLITTSPISGSTITTAPSSVTLTAQVALIADANEVIVTNPTGVRVDDGTLMVDGVSATIGLKPLTASGIYTVAYTLYSEGQIPLQGTFTFNFSAPTVTASATPTPTPTKSQAPVRSSFGTNLFIIALLVLAFFVLVGLSLYARKIFRDR
jgi:methionine-rich copper-binding protein CopC